MSVGLSVMIVSPAKMAELIKMQLGMLNGMRPGNHMGCTLAPSGEYYQTVLCGGDAALCKITLIIM